MNSSSVRIRPPVGVVDDDEVGEIRLRDRQEQVVLSIPHGSPHRVPQSAERKLARSFAHDLARQLNEIGTILDQGLGEHAERMPRGYALSGEIEATHGREGRTLEEWSIVVQARTTEEEVVAERRGAVDIRSAEADHETTDRLTREVVSEVARLQAPEGRSLRPGMP